MWKLETNSDRSEKIIFWTVFVVITQTWEHTCSVLFECLISESSDTYACMLWRKYDVGRLLLSWQISHGTHSKFRICFCCWYFCRERKWIHKHFLSFFNASNLMTFGCLAFRVETNHRRNEIKKKLISNIFTVNEYTCVYGSRTKESFSAAPRRRRWKLSEFVTPSGPTKKKTRNILRSFVGIPNECIIHFSMRIACSMNFSCSKRVGIANANQFLVSANEYTTSNRQWIVFNQRYKLKLISFCTFTFSLFTSPWYLHRVFIIWILMSSVTIAKNERETSFVLTKHLFYLSLRLSSDVSWKPSTEEG